MNDIDILAKYLDMDTISFHDLGLLSVEAIVKIMNHKYKRSSSNNIYVGTFGIERWREIFNFLKIEDYHELVNQNIVGDSQFFRDLLNLPNINSGYSYWKGSFDTLDNETIIEIIQRCDIQVSISIKKLISIEII